MCLCRMHSTNIIYLIKWEYTELFLELGNICPNSPNFFTFYLLNPLCLPNLTTNLECGISYLYILREAIKYIYYIIYNDIQINALNRSMCYSVFPKV